MKVTINELENKYRSNAKSYQEAIKAWQNVGRVSKKDGGNFVNFGKNFTNATIRQEYTWCKPSLKVDYIQSSGGWTYDTIEIDEKDTVEDVFGKINKRIQLLNGYVAEDERKARNTERVFKEVERTMKELTKFCGENGFSSYEVCNYIHDNCWRL